MNEINDELIARYLENAGDLSDTERQVAAKWAMENSKEYEALREILLEVEKSRKKKSYFIQRPQVAAASIAAIIVVLLSFLIPNISRQSGQIQAGMSGCGENPWHNTTNIPKEWDLGNGNLILNWESNALQTRLEISTDNATTWKKYVVENNTCVIPTDSLLAVDTVVWRLAFVYGDHEEYAIEHIVIHKP